LYLLEDVALYLDMNGAMTGMEAMAGVEGKKGVEDTTRAEGMKNDVRKKDKYGN
jgi:hypothetical protein